MVKKNTETARKKVDEKPVASYIWTQNVKYRGKRYRRNRPAEILPEDKESLLAAGVILAVD